MGVKYLREYEDINKELSQGISKIKDVYDFLGMGLSEWEALSQDDKDECLKTMSDDLFYALAIDHTLSVGSGTIKYDLHNNIIKVYDGDNCICIINLGHV